MRMGIHEDTINKLMAVGQMTVAMMPRLINLSKTHACKREYMQAQTATRVTGANLMTIGVKRVEKQTTTLTQTTSSNRSVHY